MKTRKKKLTKAERKAKDERNARDRANRLRKKKLAAKQKQNLENLTLEQLQALREQKEKELKNNTLRMLSLVLDISIERAQEIVDFVELKK